MKIVDFNHNHIDEAMDIALDNYNEERKFVPILPVVENLPDLTCFAENGFGVAAYEGDKMLGFLCAYYPHNDAFGTTNAKGTFSPIHAHGVIDDRILIGEKIPYSKGKLYSLLYEKAAVKWAAEGIISHAISLYSHDKEAMNSFFYNGFGLRCIDAILSLENKLDSIEIPTVSKKDIQYCEVQKDEWVLLLDMHNALRSHLGNSPIFMHFHPSDTAEFYRSTSEHTRYFAVKADGCYIAYVKIDQEGETFATYDTSMMNICGAFCKPEFRGIGVYHNLLSYIIKKLKSEGYLRLGVDFESINPTARGFWLKYFSEYTNSVVRRIDEKVIPYINR